jgi:hypothetical protein
MGIKSTLSLIAFFLAFTLSASLAWLWRGLTSTPQAPAVTERTRNSCSKRLAHHQPDALARQMAAFLRQDIANGTTRNDVQSSAEESSPASRAAAVREYVNASSRMDDSAFPREFQTAWREHMKAWRDHADYLSWRVKHDTVEAAPPEDNINETWYEVLRIARRYGVEVDGDFVSLVNE